MKHLVNTVITAICFVAVSALMCVERINELKAQVDAAEAVIDQVWNEQPDYCLDVLVEGDAYQNWQELTE